MEKMNPDKYDDDDEDNSDSNDNDNFIEDDDFFFFDLGFTALSRIFHLYRADRSSKVGENRRTRRKTT